MRIDVRKNEEHRRYEAVADGEVVGIADYVESDGVVAIPHTEVQPSRRGQGIAAEMVRAVLDDVRTQGALVDPQCSYVECFMRRDPFYADLRVPG
jgi:uncharacterized protein